MREKIRNLLDEAKRDRANFRVPPGFPSPKLDFQPFYNRRILSTVPEKERSSLLLQYVQEAKECANVQRSVTKKFEELPRTSRPIDIYEWLWFQWRANPDVFPNRPVPCSSFGFLENRIYVKKR